MHREVINFVQEHRVHRFGLPQTMTTDQGASFMSHQFKEFTASLKNRLLNSSPYYAQANDQAEASNKALIKLMKKKIDMGKAWDYQGHTTQVGIWAKRGAAHRS
jgi:hypothetical protein